MKKRLKFSSWEAAVAVGLSLILLTSVIFVGGMSGWIQTKGAYAATTYGYDPYFTATGSSNYDVSSSTSLRLQKFSVAAWFKTTQTPSAYAFIVNKGGLGVDSPGKNLNYGIWLSKSGRIQAGFEGSSGVNYFVYSPNTYNNGNWHYVVLAYGGSRLSLYMDGQQVAYRDLQVSPDNTGTQALRVGANSYALRNYFVDSIDEVRVYNRSVQPSEVSAMYSGTFSSSGQVLYLPFGTTTTADTIQPTVYITFPAEGSTVKGTITAVAAASDNVKVQKVDGYLDSTLIAAESYSPYEFDIDTTKFADGAHKFRAVATDNGGLTATAEVSITVQNVVNDPLPEPEPAPEPTPDTTVPVVVISTPAAGSTVTTSSVQVTGTASDNVGVTQVQGSIDGGSFTTATGTSSWSYAANNLVNGAHTVTIRASDAAGNVGTKSVTFTVSVSTPSTEGPTTWTPWTPSSYVVTVSQEQGAIVARDPTGATINSGSDATTVINAAVSAVKARGGGTVHINSGIYMLNSLISLASVQNMVLEGESRDTTILRTAVADAKILNKPGTTKTTNLTIRNINLDGANISGKLIDFVNVANLRIDNVVLQRHNHPAPGVYIEDLDGGLVQNSLIKDPSGNGDAFATGGYRLTFQYNEMTRMNARGGGFTSGGLVDSKILYNNFHDFKGYGAISLENFHIRADGLYSFKSIEIAYNTFKNLDSKAINTLGHGGDRDSPGTYYNIQIHDNRVENAGLCISINAYDGTFAPYNKFTYNSRIYSNTCLRTGGISAGPLKTVSFDNNIIDGSSGYRGYGIYIWTGYGKISDDVRMNGNKISNTERPAYYYTGSTNIYINGVKVA